MFTTFLAESIGITKIIFIISEYFLYKHTTLINICGIFVQI